MRNGAVMSNATIRDVAREAGVSVASVSRVMNGHDNVSAALRLKVGQVAKVLGYAPHIGARNLSMARTHAIGILLPDIHGEFFSELVRGMDREASERGFQLLLSNIHEEPASAVKSLSTMRGRVDGLVLMAPHVSTDLLFEHLPAGLPVMLVNCAQHDRTHARICIDNRSAASMMVDHLADSGHREIVFICGPHDNQEAAARLDGYRAAMEDRRLTPCMVDGNFFEDSGAAAAERLIAQGRLPDALFAANDMMAIGAMTALRQAGLSVPGDIAVAGFDDIPLARLITPALTTVSVDIAALGARALTRLSALIDGADDRQLESVAAHLVIRETSGGAALHALSSRSDLPTTG